MGLLVDQNVDQNVKVEDNTLTWYDQKKKLLLCNFCKGTGERDFYHLHYYLKSNKCDVCLGKGYYKVGESKKS